MATKVGELFVDILVNASSGNLSVRQLISAMGELEVKSLGGTYGITKLAQAFYDLSKQAMNTTSDLINFHATTGADPKMIQQWTGAAVKLGLGEDVIKRMYSGLTKVTASMKDLNANAPELFAKLGISAYKEIGPGKVPVMKKPEELAAEIAADKAKKFWTADPGQRSKWLESAGIPAEFVQVLGMMKDKTWTKAVSDVPILNAEQMGGLEKTRKGGVEIGQGLTGLAQRLVGSTVMAGITEKVGSQITLANKSLDEDAKRSKLLQQSNIDMVPFNLRQSTIEGMLTPGFVESTTKKGTEAEGKKDIYLHVIEKKKTTVYRLDGPVLNIDVERTNDMGRKIP
jgi:hypothetical protein